MRVAVTHGNGKKDTRKKMEVSQQRERRERKRERERETKKDIDRINVDHMSENK